MVIRFDLLREPVSDDAIGEWWLRAGGCLRCGAGLAAGKCICAACSDGE